MTDNNNGTLADWDALIQDYHTSGLSAAIWCQEHGFKIHQLRWQISKRQKANKKSQGIQWVPLQVNDSVPSSPIIVKIGSAQIIVTEDFNKKLFSEVVHCLLYVPMIMVPAPNPVIKGSLASPQGAQSSAIIYSIIETAKENKLNPFEYLKYLFEQLPNMDVSNQEELDKLLPWSKELNCNCFAKQ